MLTTDQAFVLHTRPYRENSLLVDVFTRQHGLLRGVYRKSAKSGKPSPFSRLSVTWSGKAELKTLRSLESDGPIFFLQGEKLFSALYANELLTRLLHPSDSHDALFEIYQQLLAQLADGLGNTELSLRYFEFGLLEELGYGYCFSEDYETGEEIESAAWYWFDPSQGVSKRAQSPGAQPQPNWVFGEDLITIASGRLDSASSLKAAKKINRLAFSVHLGGRPLKSRELFTLNRPSEKSM